MADAASSTASGVREHERDMVTENHHAACSEREQDSPRKRERSVTTLIASGLASVLTRGREGALPLLVVAAIGGGSGIGSSWLLGPGGVADDAATASDIAELREASRRQAEASQRQAEAAEAMSRAIADQVRAAELRAARLDKLDARVDACDAEIRSVADDTRLLDIWVASTLPALAGGIEQLADHVGARVRISLPDMPGRPRR